MGKDIIIDGVNVAECCCFENNRCLWTKKYYETCKVAPPCEAVKNCYFKQLQRMKKENEELKSRNANLRLNLATYDLPEVKKVLTDWRTGELDIKFKKLQKKYEKLYKALEEIRVRVNKLVDSKGYAEVEEDRIIQLLDEVSDERYR